MGRTLDQIIQNEKPAVVAEAKAKARKILKELDEKERAGVNTAAPNREPDDLDTPEH